MVHCLPHTANLTESNIKKSKTTVSTLTFDAIFLLHATSLPLGTSLFKFVPSRRALVHTSPPPTKAMAMAMLTIAAPEALVPLPRELRATILILARIISLFLWRRRPSLTRAPTFKRRSLRSPRA
jgi:hypothetical protein